MDRKRRLMENNNGWPLRSQLLDGAPFRLPLTNTAVPASAAPGTTATFTRATTATVTNNDGYLVTALSGEARFEGARRVRNLLAGSTADLNNASWAKLNGATVAVDGKTVSLTANANSCVAQSYTFVAGNKYILQFKVSVATTAKTFRLRADAVATQNSAELTATTTPTTVSFAFTAASSGAGAVYLINNAGATAGDIIVEEAQFIDVTAETDQTTPREYVSVGVASSPYYHGSFVDGVKCFATDINGAAIPSTTLLGYLAEGASTNLIVRSNELDNASWTKNSATISANGAVASDGTTSLDKIVEAAATSMHSVYQTIAGTSGSYTVSVEMKQAERTWGFITEGNSVTATAYFNLAAGTVGTVSGTGSPSATITALANGAYRCTMSFTAGANANCQFGPATGDGAASYAGDITKGIYAGMVGFENASFASSYIATTTTAVTRNADILTYSGGDIPNLKTLMAGFRREVGVGSAGAIAQLDDGTTNDFVITYLSSATAIRHQGTDGGAVQWNLPVDAVSTYVPGTACKSVQTWTTNDVKAAVNGATLTGDTAATVPTVTQLTVGHLLGALQLDGNVGPIYGWTRNQSQSELNAVTQ